jgi:hypothetical protein
MTIETKPFTDLPGLLGQLEALALSNDQIVFRGHQDAGWKIESTYARFTTIPHQSWDSSIDEMLSHFVGNALTIGTVPFSLNDRRSRLEYGRHHGVPTPVVDYTHSPWVALYFAFSGLQWRHGSKSADAAVYALDLSLLGIAWARLIRAGSEFDQAYREFLMEMPTYFQHGYPASVLKFVPFCATWNARMRNQLGCFIYDTLDYQGSGIGHGDFEGWVSSISEPLSPDGVKKPILTKFLIPHEKAGEVFARLELMNITGTKLLDHEGLAVDVKNSYNFNRKTGFAWNLEMTPPDDTKM